MIYYDQFIGSAHGTPDIVFERANECGIATIKKNKHVTYVLEIICDSCVEGGGVCHR